MVWNPHIKISREGDQNNSDVLKREKGKSWDFVSEKQWIPCSFGWEMVHAEHLISWEMVGFLLISKVWEPCKYVISRLEIFDYMVGYKA